MTPTVFGSTVLVLASFGLISWVGMFVGSRGLRKALQQKDDALEICRSEANKNAARYAEARSKVDKLEIALALKTGELKRVQADLDRVGLRRNAKGRMVSARKAK